MPRNQRRTNPRLPSTRESAVLRRRATVVHDGSGFALAQLLRDYGFQVREAPLVASTKTDEAPGQVAVIATGSQSLNPQRLRDLTRELVWKGAALLAVGAAVRPVAQVFGASTTPEATTDRRTARLAQIKTSQSGLFSELPEQIRLALPAGEALAASDLGAEFGATAWAQDGELVGASHVFRPIHLLHPGVLDSREFRPQVLANLLRLLRERGGRAF